MTLLNHADVWPATGRPWVGAAAAQKAEKVAVEWPTLALAITIYGAWAALTLLHDHIPWPLLVALGAWTVAWHGSLQHETIHGHPTRRRWLNAAIGWPPLALWLPYPLYRKAHLLHHRDGKLTHPLQDPESVYWRAADWRTLPRWVRGILMANQTLLGRLTLGPAVMAVRCWSAAVRAIRAGDRWQARVWAGHALSVAVLVAWLVWVAGMPLWLYAVAVAWPGVALSLLRSFAEHRAPRDDGQGATAAVVRAPLGGLLFLNNNLHTAHHKRPGLAWYRLPAAFRAAPSRLGALAAARGAGLYRGYGEVARRYLLRPIDHPIHPADRVGGR